MPRAQINKKEILDGLSGSDGGPVEFNGDEFVLAMLKNNNDSRIEETPESSSLNETSLDAEKMVAETDRAVIKSDSESSLPSEEGSMIGTEPMIRPGVPRGVEARRLRAHKLRNTRPSVAEATMAVEARPDINIDPSTSTEEVLPKATEVEKPKTPAGPVQVEDYVEFDGAGEAHGEQTEVVDGIDKYDQHLTESPHNQNLATAKREVGIKNLAHDNNSKKVESLFKDSLPQNPVKNSIKVTAAERDVVPQEIEPVQDEQPSGASDRTVAKIPEDGDTRETIAKLDELERKPLVDSDADVGDPANDGTPVAINLKEAEKSDPNLAKAAAAVDNEMKIPARDRVREMAAGKIEIDHVEHDRSAQPLSVFDGNKSAEIRKAEPVPTTAEPKAVAPTEVVPTRPEIKSNPEAVALPQTETEQPTAKIVEPTEAEKEQGIVGKIEPAKSLSESASTPAESAKPEIAKKPKEKISSFLWRGINWLRGKGEDVNASDANRMEAEVNKARETEPQEGIIGEINPASAEAKPAEPAEQLKQAA